MKIAYINTFHNGSTGSICTSLATFCQSKGDSVYCFYGRCKSKDSNWEFIGEGKFRLAVSNVLTYLTGRVGSFHRYSTKRLVKRLKEIKPDIIHIHNIHGNYLNFKMLFDYLSKCNSKIIFTLHDQFLMTGRCCCLPEKCCSNSKQCLHCHFKKEYPHVFVDKAHSLYLKKLTFLKRLSNVSFVTPADWLNNAFSQSEFGRDSTVKTINNGIKPVSFNKVDVSRQNNKIKLLAVAFEWNDLKGRRVLNELADLIDENKYELNVVGGIHDSFKFSKKIKYYPRIPREELTQHYLNSDIFINPSYYECFPTVCIESLAYGLPIISFNSGGCKEIIDNNTGVLLGVKNAIALKDAIEKFDFQKYKKESCYARASSFTEQKMVEQYYQVYLNKNEK